MYILLYYECMKKPLSTNPNGFRAVIFDFDGLIADTEAAIIQSWREVFEDHGCDLPEEHWVNTIGTYQDTFDPFEILEKRAGRPLDRRAIAAAQSQREWELALALPLLPGVLDYLEGARWLGLRIGLASSSPRFWVTNLLKQYGLSEFFEVVRTADDVRQIKPDPELYLAALSGLDVTAAQAFALEDSPPGLQAAQAAGLLAVAVPNQYTRRLSLRQADLLLESLTSLPFETLLDRLAVLRKNGHFEGS